MWLCECVCKDKKSKLWNIEKEKKKKIEKKIIQNNK